jgi:hypothetical protein
MHCQIVSFDFIVGTTCDRAPEVLYDRAPEVLYDRAPEVLHAIEHLNSQQI